jgi:hypothetical protein
MASPEEVAMLTAQRAELGITAFSDMLEAAMLSRLAHPNPIMQAVITASDLKREQRNPADAAVQHRKDHQGRAPARQGSLTDYGQNRDRLIRRSGG